MNKQVNPDHCYVTEDDVLYMLAPAYGTPEWHVLKDGRKHRTFTSLAAAKCWLEHVLEWPHSDRVRKAGTCWACHAKGIAWDAPRDNGNCYECGGAL